MIFVRRQDGRDQVLLQLRDGTGYMADHWAAGAAGHIERGESVFAAAREAKMEDDKCSDLRWFDLDDLPPPRRST